MEMIANFKLIFALRVYKLRTNLQYTNINVVLQLSFYFV